MHAASSLPNRVGPACPAETLGVHRDDPLGFARFEMLPPQAVYRVTVEAAAAGAARWVGNGPERLRNLALYGSPAHMIAYIEAIATHGGPARAEVLGCSKAVFGQMIAADLRTSAARQVAMLDCVHTFYANAAASRALPSRLRHKLLNPRSGSQAFQLILLSAVLSDESVPKAFAEGFIRGIPVANVLRRFWESPARTFAINVVKRSLALGIALPNDPWVRAMQAEVTAAAGESGVQMPTSHDIAGAAEIDWVHAFECIHRVIAAERAKPPSDRSPDMLLAKFEVALGLASEKGRSVLLMRMLRDKELLALLPEGYGKTQQAPNADRTTVHGLIELSREVLRRSDLSTQKKADLLAGAARGYLNTLAAGMAPVSASLSRG